MVPELCSTFWPLKAALLRTMKAIHIRREQRGLGSNGGWWKPSWEVDRPGGPWQSVPGRCAVIWLDIFPHGVRMGQARRWWGQGVSECPGSGCGGSAPGCDNYNIPWRGHAIREKPKAQQWNSLWQWPKEWVMVKVRFLKEHQVLGLRTLSPTLVNCPICRSLYHLDSEVKKTFTNRIHSVFSFLPVCFLLGLFIFPETRSNWMFSFSTSHG